MAPFDSASHVPAAATTSTPPLTTAPTTTSTGTTKGVRFSPNDPVVIASLPHSTTKTTATQPTPAHTGTTTQKPQPRPNETWYDSRDYLFFRLQARRTIRKLRKAAHPDNNNNSHEDKHCARGLEDFLSRDPRKQRTSHIQAVLHRQEQQRKEGVCDPEALRLLSTMCSKGSRARAVQLAAGSPPRRMVASKTA